MGKIKHLATLMTALVMCCLFLWLMPQVIYAAPADGATVEYSGTSGTVTWEIYSDGTMVIRPTSGDEGTMASLNGGSNGAPWYNNGSAIKSVETQGTIHLGSNAAYMFYDMSNCTSMDLSGFDTSNVTTMYRMFYYSKATSLGNLSGWDTSNVTDMSYMFSYSKATSLGDLSGWDTSNVTNMSYMFQSSKATSLGDLSGWDTSNVTNMSNMFYRSAATSLNLSEWDTSNVTDMSYMFYVSATTNLDLSEWDTSNVTNMSNMFCSSAAESLGDLSEWNTSNVTDMNYMFYNSKATNLNLSRWNTSNVTNMNGMFYSSDATSLDLSGWNTSNVTNMSSMFYGSDATSLDLSGWDTSKVTNMNSMFQSSEATSLDLSGWNTFNVTNMSRMFQSSKATSLDLSGWNTSNVTDMYSMFQSSKATSLDLSGWNTSNVTNMGNMFQGSAATSLDLSGWNTSNVTNMSSMFSDSKATSLGDLSNWNTSNVTNMSGMFYNSAATSLDLSGWDTSNVTNMSSMFSSSAVTSLDLSGWNTSNVTNMGSMFYYSKATSLDLSGWDTSNVTNMSGMFYGSAATSLDLSGWDTSKVTNMSEMFRYDTNLTNLDVNGWNTGGVTDMKQMFGNCSKLSSVTLGETFRFKGGGITNTSNQAILPNPPSSTTTRKWIRDDGTIESKTRQELRDNYDDNAALWAGKWVWEPLPTTYTVKFSPPAGDGYGGSMLDQKITAAEAGKLNKNGFFRFDYIFDHWDGSDGKTYTDEQTIPANTFNVGDTLTLTAVFTKNTHALNFIDGVADFVLHAGEKAIFSGLPGGSTYQVWEETPSGWQLTGQVNAAGQIIPNGTVDAQFTNRYVPGTATITLMAQKSLDGHLPDDGAFSFELIDAENVVVETVSNNAAGMIEFAPIIFRQPGTFVYKIREVRGDDTGINYDTHEEVITVTVQDDGHGNLTAISSSTGTLPQFENESKPGTLTITKQAQGGSTSQTFTFEIELTNEYGQSLDSVNIVGGDAE